MPDPGTGLSAGLARWVGTVHRRAGLVLLASIALSALSVFYVKSNFTINTDPDEMLSKELPYRQKGVALAEAFPQYPNSMVVVVDGPNADLVERAADELNAAIAERPDLFASVYDPQGMPFFRKNGLLFFDKEELSDLVDRLAEAQPLLGTLWTNPNLPGLLDVLRRAVAEARKGNAPLEVAFVFNQVAHVAELQAEGKTGALSWQELMRGKELDPEERRRLIVIQPVLDYGSLEPAGRALDGVRSLAKALGLAERLDARVRVTGPTALETEELRSVTQGMGLAAISSAVLVLGLLVACFRAFGPVVATLTTLFAGLLWSGALAFAVVGRLNLLSVAFVVLFVGLSVDFGIHFALRFREGIDEGTAVGEALRAAGTGVGGSLILCAVAAAISFFSFLPTNYRGLAELGTIAGTSMFVALFANLTLLPALLTFLPPRRRERAPVAAPRPREQVRSRSRKIVVAAAALAVTGSILASQIRFDFDPLKLRDPRSESVQAFFELADDKRTTPYRIVDLVGSLEEAEALAKRVSEIIEVDYATTLTSFVPKNQEEKLEILSTAALFLLPSLSGSAAAAPSTPANRRRSLQAFRTELAGMRTAVGEETEADAVRRLARAFDRLEEKRGLDDEVLAGLETRLVATLPARLADLRTSLAAGPVAPDDLPDAIRARWLAEDGRARLEVVPEASLHDDTEALQRFAAAVQGVLPDAAGASIDIVESGRAVVRSFTQATSASVVLIAALVAFLLRRVRDVLLIFAPLLLAGILTVATTVLLGLSFNFANVIVLPLLFGLGVASGIHLVMREREEANGVNVLETSTPRAVVFSALTTIGSFGSLAVSGHPGTASMGVLLTVAITMTLACTLGVLPALMQMFPPVVRAETPNRENPSRVSHTHDPGRTEPRHHSQSSSRS